MVGIRIAIGVGGLLYGLLGLAPVIPDIRARQASWNSVAFDALLMVVSILLLYRVVTADSITGLLTVTALLVLGSGIAIVAVGIWRRLNMVAADGGGPSSAG